MNFKEKEVGIYRLYKLARLTAQRFDPSIKILERDLHTVHHSYADSVNVHSEINGLVYILDENASKLYWEGKPFKTVKEFTKFEEVVTDKKEEVLEDSAKDNLKFYQDEYEKLSGKKAHHLWKEDKLIEKIEELKK